MGITHIFKAIPMIEGLWERMLGSYFMQGALLRIWFAHFFLPCGDIFYACPFLYPRCQWPEEGDRAGWWAGCLGSVLYNIDYSYFVCWNKDTHRSKRKRTGWETYWNCDRTFAPASDSSGDYHFHDEYPIGTKIFRLRNRTKSPENGWSYLNMIYIGIVTFKAAK